MKGGWWLWGWKILLKCSREIKMECNLNLWHFGIIFIVLSITFTGGFILAAMFRAGEMSDKKSNGVREWNNGIYTAISIIDEEIEGDGLLPEVLDVLDELREKILSARWDVE